MYAEYNLACALHELRSVRACVCVCVCRAEKPTIVAPTVLQDRTISALLLCIYKYLRNTADLSGELRTAVGRDGFKLQTGKVSQNSI